MMNPLGYVALLNASISIKNLSLYLFSYRSICSSDTYQIDVGFKAHLDVFPVKFHTSRSHPQWNKPEIYITFIKPKE